MAHRPQFPRDFAARWLAAWNSRDPNQILSLCTDDVVWDDPLHPSPLRGHDQVGDYLRSTFTAFPDLELVLAEPFAPTDGDRLAIYWDREGTMLGALAPPGFSPTGRRVAFDGIDLLELRDGMVCGVRSRPDARLIQQIGVLPFAESRAQGLAVLVQRLQAWRMRRS